MIIAIIIDIVVVNIVVVIIVIIIIIIVVVVVVVIVEDFLRRSLDIRIRTIRDIHHIDILIRLQSLHHLAVV